MGMGAFFSNSKKYIFFKRNYWHLRNADKLKICSGEGEGLRLNEL